MRGLTPYVPSNSQKTAASTFNHPPRHLLKKTIATLQLAYAGEGRVYPFLTGLKSLLQKLCLNAHLGQHLLQPRVLILLI
jgi:hypothetical protein